ncbi:hypothetical protein SUGI_0568080 [Cryptomeria japonica]|nr:hypothetical protein SUGI_0568080 [Cryptomeria japonica]
MLKQLPTLQKIENLKRLEILKCPNIDKFSEEFGKGEALPKLEELVMVEVEKIEKLPISKEGSLPSLKIFILMKCEALQRLPQCFWNLKSVKNIQVYGCSKVQFVMAVKKILSKQRAR